MARGACLAVDVHDARPRERVRAVAAGAHRAAAQVQDERVNREPRPHHAHARRDVAVEGVFYSILFSWVAFFFRGVDPWVKKTEAHKKKKKVENGKECR